MGVRVRTDTMVIGCNLLSLHQPFKVVIGLLEATCREAGGPHPG